MNLLTFSEGLYNDIFLKSWLIDFYVYFLLAGGGRGLPADVPGRSAGPQSAGGGPALPAAGHLSGKPAR